jgi:hypothetical protein
MGYTHYWRFHRDKMTTEDIRNTFKAVSEEIKDIIDNQIPQSKEILRGGLGEGEPIINETEIWFNGESKLDMDYETFCITWKDEVPFGFCKTARKPYDLLVCLSLLSFLNHYGSNIFQLSSDGNAEDWQEAVDLYNDVTGKEVSNPFEEAEVEA